jgi:hypothetical protein
MRKSILLFVSCLITLSLFAQGYNSKGGSHRGYQNPRQQQQPAAWSGSGIALSNNVFATNHHVVDGATNLFVYFPDTKIKYKAEVLATDAANDLAIVRVTDPEFGGFPAIQYGFKKAIEDVGMGVFVLGYPMVDTMGEEIKLTTGVVSSRSGFQGNPSQYQISAPIQPGNSGGPLFNDNGELIGIVSAKHSGADNVGYGVKLSYLYELASRSEASLNLDKSSQISTMSLSEKCKAVIPCTVMVVANNEGARTSATSPVSTSSRASEANPAGYPIHVNYPEIARKGDTSVEIYGIEVTSKGTAIYMSWQNTQYTGGWYNIDKNTYIHDKTTGKKYTLVTTENCAIAPSKTSIELGQTKEFVLYFPALPASVTSIDLCEPTTTSSWKFYGIKIK